MVRSNMKSSLYPIATNDYWYSFILFNQIRFLKQFYNIFNNNGNNK